MPSATEDNPSKPLSRRGPPVEAATPEEAAPEAGDRPRVQSVARAAAILLAVAQSPNGLTSKEISSRVKVSRQTTYHLIHTLMGVGLITRNERNRYLVGLRVATLAEAFRRQLTPPEYLAPHVREIARQTGETAYAAGWWGGEMVIFGMAQGYNAVQAAELPHSVYTSAHARASGKLMLAFAAPVLREEYLKTHPLEYCTRNTITDRARLDAEFETIRQQGYATDEEEYAEGLSCLAVPIDSGMSPFVLVLSTPAERFRNSFSSYLAVMKRISEKVSDFRGGAE